MWKITLALLATLALQGDQTSATLIMVDEEAGENSLNLDIAAVNKPNCEQQIRAVCGQHETFANNLLFGGIANKMKCLTENQAAISDTCFLKEMESVYEVIVEKQDKKCHDELRSKCGKQIDQLKRAIQDTSIIGTVKGAVDVVECVVNHAEDLWEKCKPFEGSNDEECTKRAAAICSLDDQHILGFGKSMACLAENAHALGTECVAEQVTVIMEAIEKSDEKSCHDELRKQCGKQIDELKKEIEDTSVIGILRGTVDVAQCIAQNARSLWAKCKPFHQSDIEVDECSQKMLEVCPKFADNMLGMTTTLACLTDKVEQIGMECTARQITVVMASIEATKDSQCHDEVRKKCGKQIDALKKDIDNMDVSGIIKDATGVASCLVDNSADLWEKCKPFMAEVEETDDEEPENECASKVSALCPPTEHKIMGLGFSLGCLAQHATALGTDCVKQEMQVALEAMENSDDKSCHDELRKKCGKQIDELKKEIQKTSVIGVLKGAVDVVQCVAQNAEDLWNKCKPFEQEDEKVDVEMDEAGNVVEMAVLVDTPVTGGAPSPPTRKPTRKPTKRPTRKPTKKPTHTPSVKPTKVPTKTSGTSKPSVKPSSTSKPTPRKIVEAITNQGDDEEASSVLSMMDPVPETILAQETTVEYDMEACVRSARQHCIQQVDAFNRSPFDRTLMQNLNDCIEANAALIEADCMTASTSVFVFPSISKMMEESHPPCRHADDLTSNLPLCEPRHHCKRGRMVRIAVGAIASLVLLFSVVKLSLLCYRRKFNAKQAERKPTEYPGAAYVPLKSDNAAPVATASIV